MTDKFWSESMKAGYEDVNDAERLSVDPVMRAITGKKDKRLFAEILSRIERLRYYSV